MRPVFFVILFFIILLSGCIPLDQEPHTPLALTIPENFSIQKKGGETIDKTENWWFSFGSDELNTLMTDALDNSFDLESIKSRIAQAKARVAKEEAAFFPDFFFSAGGQRRQSQTKDAGISSEYDGSHSWSGALNSSYTLDVWGEAEAGKQSEMSSLGAAENDLRSATLELTAQITRTWIDIIAVRNRKSILEQQIKINTTLLELQTLRFANGKANALDVSQQREVLAGANSEVPLLEKQEQLLLNSLAFLSGKTAIDPENLKTKILPDPLPVPRVGIPADLLENRPDIQAARMRLSSAQWEITAAKADLLPSFRLTAQALFSSGTFDFLFQNWIATLAGSIAGPLFDGGFRKAEVERVKAVAREQLNLYARTVARAIIEVENALVSIEKQEAYISLLENELSVARLTLRDARVQYQNGQSSYLSYLIAWTSIERLERQLVGERAIRIKEWIGLHAALGWNAVLPLE